MKPARIPFTLLVLIACWLTPETAAGQKRQRDVITREELENSVHRERDLHRAIQALRPHFLAPPRGNRTMGNAVTAPVQLYVNGVHQGDLETLRVIPVAEVEEVRYLEPSKAQVEFGPKNSGGVVLVKLRERLRPAEQPLPRDTTRTGRN